MSQPDRFAYLRNRIARSTAQETTAIPLHMPDVPGQRCLSGEPANPEEDDFDVIDLLVSLVRKELAGPWTREVGVYHPSSVNKDACKLALYFDRMGTPPKPSHDVSLQWIFDEGHGTHESIQSRLRRHLGFHNEIKIRINSLHVAGSADGVFVREDWVLEIKSIGESGFSTLTRPKEDHIWQLHLYMFAFDIPRGQLLYVNRNNGARRTFRVKFDPQVWGQIVELLEEVEGHVQRREPPVVTPVPFVCRNCKFAYCCPSFQPRTSQRP